MVMTPLHPTILGVFFIFTKKTERLSVSNAVWMNLIQI
ncbi:hypothetical protein SAMN05518872_10317 [Psychrobacillus sp. OK032]|nr:hypothetical protein SAMN05518872_10317 [Psychrobacillus sp. OK032]